MCGLLIMVILFRYVIWTFQIENLAYFNLYTFSRIDGICIGSMVALLRFSGTFSLKKYIPYIVLMLAVFNFLFYFSDRQSEYGLPFLAIIGYSTFAVLFGLLVNEGVEENNRLVNSIFNNRILKFFGRISYGLYVFHWPIHLLLFPVFLKWMETGLTQENTPQILSSLLTTLIAIILAATSYKHFESIFIRMKKPS